MTAAYISFSTGRSPKACGMIFVRRRSSRKSRSSRFVVRTTRRCRSGKRRWAMHASKSSEKHCTAVAATRCSRRTALFMLLMADTGLRPGEACAIQWDNLDGTNRALRIARSVENSGRVKTIKTDKSRTVDLSARLTSALIAFQASLEADAMVDGKD